MKLKIFFWIMILGFGIHAFGAEYCEVCGMNLKMQEKSTHQAKNKHYCSLHCAFEASNGKLDSIIGFDNENKKMRALNDLFYVVGSSQKSAMTSESEFGFGSKQAAQKFQKEFGGKIIEGEKMRDYVANKFQNDKNRIAQNRAKIAKNGESIAKEYCNLGNLKNIKAENIAELKIKAKKECQNIDEKGLQAVAIWLWF